MVVSHDRYFLERVTDHVLALADAKLDFLPGGVAEYLNRDACQAGKPTTAPAQVGRSEERAGPSAGRLREVRKEQAKLDRQLERVTGRESELHEALAEAAADYPRLIELGDELRHVQAEKAALEDRWLELAEEASK